MKTTILQYGKMLPGISYEDLVDYWNHKLSFYPYDLDFSIVRDDGQYIKDALDGVVADAEILLGIRITDGMLTDDFFDKHPKLKYIGTLSHAYGSFDSGMTRRRGVTITNTVYGVQTISEYTWALILAACKDMPLYGKTLGIIGQGAIGRRVASIAKAFGMKIIVFDAYRDIGNFDELVKKSDVISINSKLGEKTVELINEFTIAQMKTGVVLVNTSRGCIINEKDLLDALNSRKIIMAGLDVFCSEPPANNELLIHSPYALATGHIAWMTEEAVYRTIDIGLHNLWCYLEGKPVSVINNDYLHDMEPY